jgi:hypothetical protein
MLRKNSHLVKKGVEWVMALAGVRHMGVRDPKVGERISSTTPTR